MNMATSCMRSKGGRDLQLEVRTESHEDSNQQKVPWIDGRFNPPWMTNLNNRMNCHKMPINSLQYYITIFQSLGLGWPKLIVDCTQWSCSAKSNYWSLEIGRCGTG